MHTLISVLDLHTITSHAYIQLKSCYAISTTTINISMYKVAS